MVITEVSMYLVEAKNANERFLAFCSIVIDDVLVIHGVKVIEGKQGVFVAMPSERLMDRCPECNRRNGLDFSFCSNCGWPLAKGRVTYDERGRPNLYSDVVHPIDSSCREMIDGAVLKAYRREKEISKHPNYLSCYRYDYCPPDLVVS